MPSDETIDGASVAAFGQCSIAGAGLGGGHDGASGPRLGRRLCGELDEGSVGRGPQAQGLDRANWTHEELADHLRKTHGICTSRSAMQRFCRKIGIRVYRPTYRYLRGKPEKQAAAKQDIAAGAHIEAPLSEEEGGGELRLRGKGVASDLTGDCSRGGGAGGTAERRTSPMPW